MAAAKLNGAKGLRSARTKAKAAPARRAPTLRQLEKLRTQAIEWIDTAREDLLRGDRVDCLDSLRRAERAVRLTLPPTPTSGEPR